MGAGSLSPYSGLSPAIDRYLLILDSIDPADIHNLKKIRHTAWVDAAGKTLKKTQIAKKICFEWSQVADQLIKKAWSVSRLNETRMALFALGKLGAEELNLSSDVDLLIISEQPPSPDEQARFREFNKLLSQNDEVGFVLRTDYDLRPGGRFGPTIITIGQAEDYYWNHGATWERLANVRLRPITGNAQLIQAYQDLIRRYIYRRHIDFSLLEDLKNLRTQIHDTYQTQDRNHFNLKLGIGGIRDIELFAHALLIIHGGRNPNLIHHQTDEIYNRLLQNHVYKSDDLIFLRDTYWEYRQLENELQAQQDEQTHIIGFEKKEDLLPLQKKAEKVNLIVSDLLGAPSKKEKSFLNLDEFSFSNHSKNEVWPKLLSLSALSTRSEFDESMRKDFLSQFLHQLAKDGIDKDLGLALLYDFLKATRAKASFYSLFVNEPKITRDLARLFSISPYLGQILASRPELIDSFLFGQHMSPKKLDLEETLLFSAEKKWLNEVFAALALLDQKDIAVVTEQLSSCADEIVSLLVNELVQEHGSQPVYVLALGKWGGREIGLRSDLDFIFVTESDSGAAEQKVARRLLSIISTAQKGGMIYQVDLRLRPSGKAGPILVRYDQLLSYLKTSAAAWERQSYLKSRFINCTHLNRSEILNALFDRPLTESDREELFKIRAQLIKGPTSTIDLKYNPGGLIDIEFASQIKCLEMQKTPDDNSSIFEILRFCKSNDLLKNYSELRRYEQLLSLMSGAPLHLFEESSDSAQRLARYLKTTEVGLAEQLRTILQRSTELVKSLDPIFTSR